MINCAGGRREIRAVGIQGSAHDGRLFSSEFLALSLAYNVFNLRFIIELFQLEFDLREPCKMLQLMIDGHERVDLIGWIGT